jgi:CAP-Gly domain-containing linker protein 1
LQPSFLLESLLSVGSAAGVEQQAHIDRLQSRLDALEYENERLRSTMDKPNPPGLDVSSNETQAAEASSLMTRILELEARLQAAESSFDERDSVIDSLQNTLADSEKQKSEGDRRIAEFETKLAESVTSAKGLSKIIEQKEAKEQELASILNTRKSEIDALEGQVDHLSAQLEDERTELGGQINELRQAGQVCHLLTTNRVIQFAESSIRKPLLFTRNA